MGIYASPSGLLMVKRDPTLALYPIAIDDFAAGQLLNAQTNVNATMAGGSTLLAAAKRRNDFQRLSSTFPGLGYRASGAVTNLLWALDPDNGSFEGGTKGTTLFAADASYTIPSAGAWHGNRYLETTVGPTLSGTVYWLASSVVASGSHVYSAWLKAKDAASVGRSAYTMFREHGGSNPGDSYGNAVVLSLDWQLSSVTRTISADRTAISAFAKMTNPTAAGQGFGLDGNILTAGATVPQFEEAECVATTCTFPTPFTAGSPFSAVFFVWTPWPGNDGALHTIFDSQGTGAAQNRILIQKTAANNLEFNIWDNATNLKQCSEAVTAVNWPAGTMKRVTISRDAGVMNAFLNGVVFGTLNAGAGTGLESALGANSYIGTDNAGANQLNGVMMPYMYEGYAWSAEEHGYYSTLQAPPPRTRRIA